MSIAARALGYIYGGERPEFDETAIATRIAEVLREARVPSRGSATVILRFAPDENSAEKAENGGRSTGNDAGSGGNSTKNGDGFGLSVQFERTLFDVGYAVSSLRPEAVTYEYSIPFPGFPTSFQLSAQALFDALALSWHKAGRSVRKAGEKLLMCGDAPLFGIRGKTLFTAPLTDGVPDSVERRAVIAAAREAKLDLLEEAVPHSELTGFDELFFADAAGITSLAGCDGTKFMSLAARRIVERMREK